ncbi:Transcriptional regulator, TetR family (fragment) (plasmid) [Streptantibioticus cattleyicolor NRRL 8057 = DSM 46488]
MAAFARALPGLCPDELWFRMRRILAVTAVDRVGVHKRPSADPSPAGEAARRGRSRSCRRR